MAKDIDADRGTVCIVYSKRSSGNLHFLYRHSLIKRFRNISADFRIALTLPVSVVTGDRSFSQQKLIKSYNHVARQIDGSSHLPAESGTFSHDGHCQSV